MELTVLTAYIVAIVGSNKANAVLLCQFNQALIGCSFFRQAVILDFEKVILLAENIYVFLYKPVSLFLIVLNQSLWHITSNTGRQADNSLMVLAQNLLVYPGLIVHALDIGQRYQLYQILIAGLIFCQQNQMIIFDMVDFLPFLSRAGR